MADYEPIPESDLRNLWGECPEPKFEEWWDAHGEKILSRTTIHKKTNKHWRTLMRALNISAAVAACMLLFFLTSNHFQSPVYAQAIDQIRSAKSISWKHEFYLRATSKDGQRTWLHKMSSRRYYQPPGRYRIESLNGKGNVIGIEIRDLEQGKELSLNPRTNVATIRDIDRQASNTSPLEWILKSMKENPLELLGPRSTASGSVNVFRRVVQSRTEDRYLDYWVSTESKNLIQFRNSIENPLDPESDPDRDNPAEPGEWKGTRALGSIESEFELDPELSDDLFSLDAPSGYELERIEKSTVNESEMLEYLTAAVKFSGGVFPESPDGMMIDSEKYDAIFAKPKREWSESELQVAELVKKSMLREGPFPLLHYVHDHAVPGSFRYIGSGVKLGEKDRFVCWYKLHEDQRYRAIYGDLSVGIVDVSQLPLSP